MLKSIASAIAKANGDDFDALPLDRHDARRRWQESGVFYDPGHLFRADYLAMARAAVEAIREPSKAMVRAGDDCHSYAFGVSTPTEYAEVEVIYSAMISVILDECTK